MRVVAHAMEYTAQVHHEDGMYWAEVDELPGCFASGETLDELGEALAEAISLYQADDDESTTPPPVSGGGSVKGLRVLVGA
jgi:predicted RNase H-like HicB family nuclease